MYKKILCPVNGSEKSLKAVKHALELADFCGGELLLLHVSPSILDDDEETMLRIPLEKFHQQEDEVIREMTQAIHDILKMDGIRQLAERVKYNISMIGSHDNTGKSIVNFAEKQNVDIIVMTKHSRSVTWELVRGSVSMYVTHHAGCIMMLIPDF